MNQSDLIDAIAARVGAPKSTIKEIIDQIGEVVVESVSNGEQVVLGKLGSFNQVERPARTARNPKTGESISVPAKNTVKFKPSSTFKKAVEG